MRKCIFESIKNVHKQIVYIYQRSCRKSYKLYTRKQYLYTYTYCSTRISVECRERTHTAMRMLSGQKFYYRNVFFFSPIHIIPIQTVPEEDIMGWYNRCARVCVASCNNNSMMYNMYTRSRNTFFSTNASTRCGKPRTSFIYLLHALYIVTRYSGTNFYWVTLFLRRFTIKVHVPLVLSCVVV